ncbi:MAG: hypothetical protein KJZ74_09305 [Gemmatimonadales bacterium]|nr:hypothetical protein [Gemmatimonadota bacterium]MCL4214100.1 hypothetical protein [Gemmatimonadales bacterium]
MKPTEVGMDLSVALVQAYLRVNGYFTVAEFPVVESVAVRGAPDELRTATDIDIMGFRFPRSAQLVPASGRRSARDRRLLAVDPAIGAPPESGDMIIGEVKEGRAELNANATAPSVLRAALIRFGCCDPEHAVGVVDELAVRGKAVLPNGHAVRLLAFGTSTSPTAAGRPFVHTVSLVHIRSFLREYVHTNWRVLKAGGTKDEALSWVYLEEKMAQAAARGGRR